MSQPQRSIAQLNMIRSQILPSIPNSNPALIEVLQDIPRAAFVPPHLQKVAYVDDVLPVNKDGRFMMSPLQFALMAELAHITEKDQILDIAPGTGYSSAIFARLAAKIMAVEPDPELASRANQLLHQLHLNNVITLTTKCAEGYPEAAPYDVIFINGAVSHIPTKLTDQLAEGGRLITVRSNNVLPTFSTGRILGSLIRITKQQGQLVTESLYPVSLFSIDSLLA